MKMYMLIIYNEHNNKSPLRYPGGKTRATKKLETILNENFNITTLTILFHRSLVEVHLNFISKILTS